MMRNLPDKIKEGLIRLRATHEHYVEVKIIKGHYYAFEVTGKWDKKLKKKFKITHYLGRIKEDSTFVPARHKQRSQHIPMPTGIIESPHEKQNHAKYDEIILRNLSMNGRMPIPTLAKTLKLSVTATRYQVKKVEEKYSIKYTIEINLAKVVGYLIFSVLVKFIDKIPSISEIKQSIESEPYISTALLTTGAYDMVMFLVVNNSQQMLDLVNKLRTSTNLKHYKSTWQIAPRLNVYGSIPVKGEFFNLLKNTAWKRTKETPRPKSGELTYRDFILLKELADNGKIDFSEIDEKYRMDKGSSQYTYHKLVNKGIIERITIIIQKFPLKYNALFIANIIDDDEFRRVRYKRFEKIIEDNQSILNKYVLVSTIGAPFGQIYIAPILTDYDLDSIKNEIEEINKGCSISTLVITSILTGNFYYRKFDNKYTNIYETLSNENKIPKTGTNTLSTI